MELPFINNDMYILSVKMNEILISLMNLPMFSLRGVTLGFLFHTEFYPFPFFFQILEFRNAVSGGGMGRLCHFHFCFPFQKGSTLEEKNLLL